VVFSSVTFLFYFLPLFLLAYHLLPWRNAVLLAASLLFYAWGDLRQVPLLLASIGISYTAGLFAARPGRAGRTAVVLGVIGNLALLAWYKYAGFLAAQLAALLTAFHLPAPPVPTVALPLGISFFTFQGISYVIDIRRGIVAPQPSLLKFAMYKSMFPQLVAGPIVRYATIAGQIEARDISAARLDLGVQTFVIGLAQKVLLANTLASPVDAIFALPPDRLSTLAAWLGASGYALQIYFDFCGYSNMAIGLGRMMGFELPPNFNRPYVSQSLTEFWRRWHISLSTWFRDYLYVPLGGNRKGTGRTYANLAVVFLFCGLWHGASWSFALWGAWHGAFLILERLGLGDLLRKLPRVMRHVYLLLVVILGWVPFRANNLGQVGWFLRAMTGFGTGALPDLSASTVAALLIGAVAAVWPPGAFGRFVQPIAEPRYQHAVLRPAICLALFALSAASLASGTYNPFIYFRF
jgi:alginate O-acetyltransferase complex protein AlgI